MNTSVGMNGLLDATVSTVISTAGNYERVSPAWSKIVNIDALTERARELLSNPDEGQKRRAQRFLTALERQGKDPF